MLQIYKAIFLALFLSFSTHTIAQDASEKELSKKATELFEKQEFLIAEKMYSKLVSINSSEPIYNSRYGACLLLTGQNRNGALKYLKFAYKAESGNKETVYYLARAFQTSYYFTEALKMFETYKAMASKKEIKNNDVETYIAQCKAGQIIVGDFYNLQVIKSTTIKRSQFYRAYDLGSSGLKILVKPAQFTLPEDQLKKGNNDDPLLVVQSRKEEKLYFSAHKYAKEKFNVLDRDIFLVEKGADEIWSDFIFLGDNINTDMDEDFVYFHPNGRDLYFSSKGHEGLGGYDIYKSTLDTVSNVWSKPMNMGFPINSPYDDILYIVDEKEEVAYFASNRNTGSDEVEVFQILTHSNFDNYVLFTGKVTVERGNSNKVEIRVFNGKKQLIGNYTSDAKTGNFSIPLPELDVYQLDLIYEGKTTLKHHFTVSSKSKRNMMVQNFNLTIGFEPSLKVENLPDSANNFAPETYEMLSRLQVSSLSKKEFGKQDEENSGPDLTFLDTEKSNANLNKAQILNWIKEELQEIDSTKMNIGLLVNSAYALAKSKEQEYASSFSGEDQNDKKIQYCQDMKELLLVTDNLEYNLNAMDRKKGLFIFYQNKVNNSTDSKEELSKLHQQFQQELNQFEAVFDQKQLDVIASISSLKEKRAQLKQEVDYINAQQAASKKEVETLSIEINKTKDDEIVRELVLSISTIEKRNDTLKLLLEEDQYQLEKINDQLNQLTAELDAYSHLQEKKESGNSSLTAPEERAQILQKINTHLSKEGIEPVVLENSEKIDLNFIADELNKRNNQNASTSNQMGASTSYFDISSESINQYENPLVREQFKVQQDLRKETEQLSQLLAQKQKELEQATDESEKVRLQTEIKQLRQDLFKKEQELIVSTKELNKTRYTENNNKLNAALESNPNAKAQYADLKTEINQLWSLSQSLEKQANAEKDLEKNVILGKEMLTVQINAIDKQFDLANTIINKPSNVVNNDIASNQKTTASTTGVKQNQLNSNPTSTEAPSTPLKSTRASNTYSTSVTPISNPVVASGFEISNKNTYDENTVLPLDPPLPTGLIFKVQVGAFRNKINPVIFNGISPLNGESTGAGFIRYTAGLFYSFKAADMAKGRIRNLGYKDAFVVAFYNGKRISIEEAKNKIQNNPEQLASLKNYTSTEQKEVKELISAGIKEEEAYTTTTNAISPIEKYNTTNSRGSAVKNKIPALKTEESSPAASGVFLTVQIGVYKTERTSDQLFGITPIYINIDQNGLIHHSHGVFYTIDAANQKKKEIQAIGIKDAFVVAYHNGVRIPVEQALTLMGNQR